VGLPWREKREGESGQSERRWGIFKAEAKCSVEERFPQRWTELSWLAGFSCELAIQWVGVRVHQQSFDLCRHQ